MKKTALVSIIFSVLLVNTALAYKDLKKPVDGGGENYFVKLGATVDSATVTSTLSESSGELVANGSSFTVNGTSLTKANKLTLSNGTSASVTYKGTSANQVAVITLTRFYLPQLKTSGGGPQANGALLFTLPAGTQQITGPALNNLKLFSGNGQVAIKSNGTVLSIGSTKAGGAVKVLSGTASFQDILTGQQIQQNGRTLNAGSTTAYQTLTGGTKTGFINYANGYPAVANGTLWVNGTIAVPIIHKY